MIKKHAGHVKGIIDGLINELEKKTAPKGSAVMDAWSAAVEKGALAHSRPVSYKKAVLVVVVENSSWLYKMTLEKNKILKKFNDSYSGRVKAKEIRFRIGTFGD